MHDEVRQALMIGRSASLEERTVDITTTGRRSGEQRRIEIAFYRFEDSIYLSGIPSPGPRAWLLNLAAEPRFIFHLKNRVAADLPAVATIITDPVERRRVLVASWRSSTDATAQTAHGQKLSSRTGSRAARSRR